jgi:hypothetical protein
MQYKVGFIQKLLGPYIRRKKIIAIVFSVLIYRIISFPPSPTSLTYVTILTRSSSPTFGFYILQLIRYAILSFLYTESDVNLRQTTARQVDATGVSIQSRLKESASLLGVEYA